GRDADAAVSWTDLDLGRVVRLAAPGSAIVPATTTKGALTASGPLSRTNQWTADARVEMSPGTNGRNRIAIGGAAHASLSMGHWKVDGQHRVGGLVPIAIAARGRMLEGSATNSTLTGYIEVGETALLPLFDLLRTTGIADVPAGMISSGAAQANVELSGTLL